MTTINAPEFLLPEHLLQYINLADSSLGARVIKFSDQSFAEANRMLQTTKPIFITDKYDDFGKWMDGWETKRRRDIGHDWAIIKLFKPGIIKAIDIDTSFFTGNYPEAFSLEATYTDDDTDQVQWFKIYPNTKLNPNMHHILEISNNNIISHVKINIYPDGGIARLRIYGNIKLSKKINNKIINLAAVDNGATIVAFSDAHFGEPSNMLKPGVSSSMADGWETKRRRSPGFDWCIISLAKPGLITKIEIDTKHFKGNFPDTFSIQAVNTDEAIFKEQIIAQSIFWPYLIHEKKLQADQNHIFANNQLHDLGKISHIRLNMLPDGGISRLKIWGTVA